MTHVTRDLPGRLLRARLVPAYDVAAGPGLQQRGGQHQHQQAQHDACPGQEFPGPGTQ